MKNAPDVVFDSPLPAAPLAEFRNFTPFPSQYFQTVDPADQVFHVVVVRVTHTLRRVDKDGSLLLADEQTPLAQSDVCHGEINRSSIKWESDFAPYKPKCDVLLVNATAHSPEGKARPMWPVKLQVGDWSKTLIVTGPRRFRRTRTGGYELTDPEPATELPLTYEHAYGGENRWPDPLLDGQAPELWRIDERNPVGRGFRDGEWLKRAKPEAIPAPQIELPDRPYRGEADYPVCGFGAIARPWQPRRPLAGTYDQAWKESRWPRLPLDHDYAYWNCAPADQQIGYPQGGEAIVLHNLQWACVFRVTMPVS